MSVPRDPETERLLLGSTETHTHHETPTHRATNPSFPRVFYKRHLFSIMFNQVVGLAFYVTAGTVLRTGGQAPMILSLLFLGLLVVLVNRDVVQMLRTWPISTSLVIFVQSFIDPHLGIVIGWLSWMKLCCWLALLMVEIVSLAETLGMNRAATFAVKATMVAIPVLFNLMDTRWFTWFQMWLTAIKSLALTAVFGIMLYVNLFAAQQEHQLVSREDKVFVGNGLAETFRGLVFAMYMFCSAFIGVETLSMVAPEVIRREKGEEEIQLSQDPTNDDRFSVTSRAVLGSSLMIYFLKAWIIGENVEGEDARLPRYDGRVDATSSVFITSAKAKSEALGVWVIVLLMIIGISAAVSTLFVAARSLYWMSVIYSGQHDGTHRIRDGRTKLEWCWSILSRRTMFYVPRGSVLTSTILSVALVLVHDVMPDATALILYVLLQLVCTTYLVVLMLQSITAAIFYRCSRDRSCSCSPAFMPHDNRWFTLHCALSCIKAAICMLLILGGHCTAYHFNRNTLQLVCSILILVLPICAYILSWFFYGIDSDRRFGVDLSDPEVVKKKFQTLNDACTANYGSITQLTVELRDMFGIIDRDRREACHNDDSSLDIQSS